MHYPRFLGLALEDKVPDARTVWLCREVVTGRPHQGNGGLIEGNCRLHLYGTSIKVCRSQAESRVCRYLNPTRPQ